MTATNRLPLLISLIYLQCYIIQYCNANSAAGSGGGGGTIGMRHSYSLSTFSPNGNIDQVVRAMRASLLGVPIVALSIPSSSIDNGGDGAKGVSKSAIIRKEHQMVDATPSSSSANLLPQGGGIYLSIPLRFLTTSPFLIDDGTPRIIQLTSSLCVAHTGVGADGRALCDIATELALDYRYVYGEEISVEELLEGLAEKVQEMTMKGGSRPFGCALFVGCLGSDDGNCEPTMFRLDPSGAVVLLNSCDDNDDLSTCNLSTNDKDKGNILKDNGRKASTAFLGNWDSLRQRKDVIRNQLERHQFANEEELQEILVDAARQTYMVESSLSDRSSSPQKGEKERLNQPVLFASFTRERGLEIARIMR